MEFVCNLVINRAIQVQTAANYLSHVQGYHEKATGVRLCGGLKMGRLPAMMKGLRRILGVQPTKVRRGVAAQALRRAMDMTLDPTIPAHANIRAALATAFQGLLRSAEYCDDGTRARGKSPLDRVPSRADVRTLDDSKMVLMTSPCKNMRHLSGKDVPLVIGAGGAHIDAVAEVKNLLRVDPTPAGSRNASTPLFRDPSSNRPLTCEYVRVIIKRLMEAVGENPDDFGTHSLRIGGATALFAAGATPTVIRTMGRWSSDCYQLYVRACFEASMAWTAAAGSTAVTDLAGHEDFDEVDDY